MVPSGVKTHHPQWRAAVVSLTRNSLAEDHSAALASVKTKYVRPGGWTRSYVKRRRISFVLIVGDLNFNSAMCPEWVRPYFHQTQQHLQSHGLDRNICIPA